MRTFLRKNVGAVWGMTLEQHPQGAKVVAVQPNSVMSRFGWTGGEIISSFNGISLINMPIASINKLFATNNVGDIEYTPSASPMHRPAYQSASPLQTAQPMLPASTSPPPLQWAITPPMSSPPLPSPPVAASATASGATAAASRSGTPSAATDGIIDLISSGSGEEDLDSESYDYSDSEVSALPMQRSYPQVNLSRPLPSLASGSIVRQMSIPLQRIQQPPAIRNNDVIDLVSDDDDDDDDDEVPLPNLSRPTPQLNFHAFGRINEQPIPAERMAHSVHALGRPQPMRLVIASPSSSIARPYVSPSVPPTKSVPVYLRKIQRGNIEIKIEHEPKKFGEANIENEIEEISVVAPPVADVRTVQKRKRTDLEDDDDDDNDGSDSALEEQNKEDESDENLDVKVVGGKMLFAVDMPHQREACSRCRFDYSPFPNTELNKQHCKNCYCYFCETKASDCILWGTHCNANCKNPKWKISRDVFQGKSVKDLPPSLRPIFLERYYDTIVDIATRFSHQAQSGIPMTRELVNMAKQLLMKALGNQMYVENGTTPPNLPNDSSSPDEFLLATAVLMSLSKYPAILEEFFAQWLLVWSTSPFCTARIFNETVELFKKMYPMHASSFFISEGIPVCHSFVQSKGKASAGLVPMVNRMPLSLRMPLCMNIVHYLTPTLIATLRPFVPPFAMFAARVEHFRCSPSIAAEAKSAEIRAMFFTNLQGMLWTDHDAQSIYPMLSTAFLLEWFAFNLDIVATYNQLFHLLTPFHLLLTRIEKRPTPVTIDIQNSLLPHLQRDIHHQRSWSGSLLEALHADTSSDPWTQMWSLFECLVEFLIFGQMTKTHMLCYAIAPKLVGGPYVFSGKLLVASYFVKLLEEKIFSFDSEMAQKPKLFSFVADSNLCELTSIVMECAVSIVATITVECKGQEMISLFEDIHPWLAYHFARMPSITFTNDSKPTIVIQSSLLPQWNDLDERDRLLFLSDRQLAMEGAPGSCLHWAKIMTSTTFTTTKETLNGLSDAFSRTLPNRIELLGGVFSESQLSNLLDEWQRFHSQRATQATDRETHLLRFCSSNIFARMVFKSLYFRYHLSGSPLTTLFLNKFSNVQGFLYSPLTVDTDNSSSRESECAYCVPTAFGKHKDYLSLAMSAQLCLSRHPRHMQRLERISDFAKASTLWHMIDSEWFILSQIWHVFMMMPIETTARSVSSILSNLNAVSQLLATGPTSPTRTGVTPSEYQQNLRNGVFSKLSSLFPCITTSAELSLSKWIWPSVKGFFPKVIDNFESVSAVELLSCEDISIIPPKRLVDIFNALSKMSIADLEWHDENMINKLADFAQRFWNAVELDVDKTIFVDSLNTPDNGLVEVMKHFTVQSLKELLTNNPPNRMFCKLIMDVIYGTMTTTVVHPEAQHSDLYALMLQRVSTLTATPTDEVSQWEYFSCCIFLGQLKLLQSISLFETMRTINRQNMSEFVHMRDSLKLWLRSPTEDFNTLIATFVKQIAVNVHPILLADTLSCLNPLLQIVFVDKGSFELLQTPLLKRITTQLQTLSSNSSSSDRNGSANSVDVNAQWKKKLILKLVSFYAKCDLKSFEELWTLMTSLGRDNQLTSLLNCLDREIHRFVVELGTPTQNSRECPLWSIRALLLSSREFVDEVCGKCIAWMMRRQCEEKESIPWMHVQYLRQDLLYVLLTQFGPWQRQSATLRGLSDTLIDELWQSIGILLLSVQSLSSKFRPLLESIPDDQLHITPHEAVGVPSATTITSAFAKQLIASITQRPSLPVFSSPIMSAFPKAFIRLACDINNMSSVVGIVLEQRQLTCVSLLLTDLEEPCNLDLLHKRSLFIDMLTVLAQKVRFKHLLPVESSVPQNSNETRYALQLELCNPQGLMYSLFRLCLNLNLCRFKEGEDEFTQAVTLIESTIVKQCGLLLDAVCIKLLKACADPFGKDDHFFRFLIHLANSPTLQDQEPLLLHSLLQSSGQWSMIGIWKITHCLLRFIEEKESQQWLEKHNLRPLILKTVHRWWRSPALTVTKVDNNESIVEVPSFFAEFKTTFLGDKPFRDSVSKVKSCMNTVDMEDFCTLLEPLAMLTMLKDTVEFTSPTSMSFKFTDKNADLLSENGSLIPLIIRQTPLFSFILRGDYAVKSIAVGIRAVHGIVPSVTTASISSSSSSFSATAQPSELTGADYWLMLVAWQCMSKGATKGKAIELLVAIEANHLNVNATIKQFLLQRLQTLPSTLSSYARLPGWNTEIVVRNDDIVNVLFNEPFDLSIWPMKQYDIEILCRAAPSEAMAKRFLDFLYRIPNMLKERMTPGKRSYLQLSIPSLQSAYDAVKPFLQDSMALSTWKRKMKMQLANKKPIFDLFNQLR